MDAATRRRRHPRQRCRCDVHRRRQHLLPARRPSRRSRIRLLPVFLVIDLSGVGGLLIVRRPGNPIGALLLFAGVLSRGLMGWGLLHEPRRFGRCRATPFVVPLAWLTGWIFTPTIGLMAVFVPMLYPTGHLPGPRWRIVVGIAIVAISIGMLATATKPGPMGNFETILNPVVLEQPWSDLIQTLGSLQPPPGAPGDPHRLGQPGGSVPAVTRSRTPADEVVPFGRDGRRDRQQCLDPHKWSGLRCVVDHRDDLGRLSAPRDRSRDPSGIGCTRSIGSSRARSPTGW